MATGLHKDLPDSEIHEVKGAAAASAGHVLTADGAGSATFQAGGGGSSIFGSELTTVEDLAVSTTLSTTFQNKVTMVTASVPAGSYRLDWSYQWNHDSVTSDFEAQLLQGAAQLFLHKQEPKDSAGTFGTTGTSQQYVAGGFIVLTLSGGVETFTMEYRTDVNPDESSIWNARLMLYRIS